MRGIYGRLSAAFLGLGGTVTRFPMPLACALTAAVCMAINRPGATLNDAIEDTLSRLILAGIVGFFLTLGLALIAERRAWPVWRGLVGSAIGLALLAAKVFWDEPELGMHSVSIVFLGPASVLFAATAAFLPGIGGGGDDAFWEFNKTAWLACVLGFAAALALSIGGASALSVIEYLFHYSMNSRPYWYLNVVAFSLVCPWLALSGIPRDFNAPADTEMPRWLAIMATYIFVPLAVAYILILYAYIGLIVVQWDLPRGRVAYIVAGCAIYGIIVHMAVFPLRRTGGWLVRLYHKLFYPALSGPVVLMAIGLIRRIDAYGVTEGRYGVALLALWLAAMVVLHVVPLRRRLVWVPLSVAAPLLLASFGPWGAFSVSESIQMARLERLLTESGILKDGTVTPAKKQVTGAPARDITSVVRYLRESGKLTALRPLMAGTKVNVDDNRPTVKTIVLALGVEHRWGRWGDDTFYYANQDLVGINIWGNGRPALFDTQGYRLFGFINQDTRYSDKWWSYEGPKLGELYRLSLDPKTGILRIDGPDARADIKIDLNRIAAKVRPLKDKERGKHMVIEAAGRTLRVRLMLMDLRGKIVGGEAKVSGLEAIILIGDKKR